MGEYFKAVNLTKREQIHPHRIGNGLKHGEWISCEDWGFGRSDTMKALDHLKQTRWAGDDVRVVSDYVDEELYDEAEESFKDISYEVKAELGMSGKSWCIGEPDPAVK